MLAAPLAPAHKDRAGALSYAVLGAVKVARARYMHMIRLYSGMLFQHPALHFYRTYVR